MHRFSVKRTLLLLLWSHSSTWTVRTWNGKFFVTAGRSDDNFRGAFYNFESVVDFPEKPHLQRSRVRWNNHISFKHLMFSPSNCSGICTKLCAWSNFHPGQTVTVANVWKRASIFCHDCSKIVNGFWDCDILFQYCYVYCQIVKILPEIVAITRLLSVRPQKVMTETLNTFFLSSWTTRIEFPSSPSVEN